MEEFPASPQHSSRHYPLLDGLRGVSILLVLLSHAGLQHLVPGGLGVVIFFVISGFLITHLMFDEIDNSGTLNIRLFYIRRILRLMPALLLSLVLFVPALIFFGAQISGLQIASVLLYFANYYHIYIEYPPYSMFPIFWSLAVEEHFYIFFPFIILLFHKNTRALLLGLGALSLSILAWRIHLNSICLNGIAPYDLCGVQSEIGDRIFHGTDSIADCILYGAIIPVLFRLNAQQASRFLINNAVLLASVVVLLLTVVYRNPDFRETLRYTLQASSVAVIIANLLFERAGKANTLLENKILITIGKWSYALYIFHYAVLSLIGVIHGTQDQLSGATDLALYFFSSFALAGATYTLIERPIQKLRRKFHTPVIIHHS